MFNLGIKLSRAFSSLKKWNKPEFYISSERTKKHQNLHFSPAHSLMSNLNSLNHSLP